MLHNKYANLNDGFVDFNVVNWRHQEHAILTAKNVTLIKVT